MAKRDEFSIFCEKILLAVIPLIDETQGTGRSDFTSLWYGVFNVGRNWHDDEFFFLFLKLECTPKIYNCRRYPFDIPREFE